MSLITFTLDHILSASSEIHIYFYPVGFVFVTHHKTILRSFRWQEYLFSDFKPFIKRENRKDWQESIWNYCTEKWLVK